MLQKVLAVILVIACLTVSSVFADDATLDVLVYDSYAVSEDLVAAFESANQVRLQFIEAGDGTELLNRAILTKNAPLADVILGIAVSAFRTSSRLGAGLFAGKSSFSPHSQ